MKASALLITLKTGSEFSLSANKRQSYCPEVPKYTFPIIAQGWEEICYQDNGLKTVRQVLFSEFRLWGGLGSAAARE